MGGWIGTGMAKHHPERLLSLTLGGWDVEYGAKEAVAAMQFDPADFDSLLQGAAALDASLVDGISDANYKALEQSWFALAQIEGAVSAVGTLEVPVMLWVGVDDWYHANSQTLAAHLDIPFCSVGGDHMVAAGSAEALACVTRFLASMR